MQYFCQNEQRKRRVREHPTLNGIDYLELGDGVDTGDELRQDRLRVRFLKWDYVNELKKHNIRIEGGERIRYINVIEACIDKNDSNVLCIKLDRYGDFSTYRLRIVKGPGQSDPPEWLDALLSSIPFSFKVACPSDFDCKKTPVCATESIPPPEIDYLAKDYASFRQLMYDRLSTIMPQWQERNVADFGVALVETLAYVADHLSYYQDAVATEAYLGTARRRVSVRRHARLLDYSMHDGCNARTWVVFEVSDGADGYVLPAHTPLLTKGTVAEEIEVHERRPAVAGKCTQFDLSSKLQRESEVSRYCIKGLDRTLPVFETMHKLALHADFNEIEFYTWGDDKCCLPKGATKATLNNEKNKLRHLKVGDLLLFEEVLGITTDGLKGSKADANAEHRHVVRLIRVEFTSDLLEDEAPYITEGEERSALRVVNIEWGPEDALPFPLCLWQVEVDSSEPRGRARTMDRAQRKVRRPVSVVRGNVVLADHGRTVCDEPLVPEATPANARYRPRLRHSNVTFHVPYDDDVARGKPAAGLLIQDPGAALSDVLLQSNNETWNSRLDLLDSDRFAREFVTETEDDGRAFIRFGDDILGKRPVPGTTFKSTYRIGNGSAGNVGAETINRVVLPKVRSAIASSVSVRNPLPAKGGTDPESINEVRNSAPRAFRTQQRAVTPNDYADMSEHHSEVQEARAIRRWTGSWYTMFVSVDRKGGRPVDSSFEQALRTNLEKARMMGHDLDINSPNFVALDIALVVVVAEENLRSTIKASLLELFSAVQTTDGQLGFFHPDKLTFGQSIYLSNLIAEAMKVPGVARVIPERFQRWDRLARNELQEGKIEIGPFEIPRLDNDLNAPENGRIEFIMKCGQ